MSKRILIFLIIIPIVLLSFVGCKKEEKKDLNPTWTDFIKIHDVTYSADIPYSGRALNDSDIGDVYGTVRYSLNDANPDDVETISNGYAAYLPVNSKIYEVKNYSNTFRVAAKVDEKWVLYESISITDGKKANEYYDIKDKVEYITLNAEEYPNISWIIIDDKDKVEDLVNKILDCEVLSSRRGIGESFYIVFHLKDGTTVTRRYWHILGIMYPGVQITEDITLILQKVIEES